MSEDIREIGLPIGVLPDINVNVKHEVVLGVKALATLKYIHKAMETGEVPVDVFERWVRTTAQAAFIEGYERGQQEAKDGE